MRLSGAALRLGVGFTLFLALASGCSTHDHPGSWSVRSVSLDGRTLRLGVDVSCQARVVSSHVRENPNRVTVEVTVHEPGGNCEASLEVRPLDVQLRAPLGRRVVEGACVPSCPTFPDRVPVDCHGTLPPFWLGYLPSGWQQATTLPAGVAVGYQSPTGDATVELRHAAPDASFVPRTDISVPTLGSDVTFGNTPDGEAAVFSVAGSGPACGQWLIAARGLAQTELAQMTEQLVPR